MNIKAELQKCEKELQEKDTVLVMIRTESEQELIERMHLISKEKTPLMTTIDNKGKIIYGFMMMEHQGNELQTDFDKGIKVHQPATRKSVFNYMTKF